MEKKLKKMESNQPRKGSQVTLGALLQTVSQPANENNQKKKRNQWKPEYSRFKLKCFYKDGNTSVHYSYDIYHRYTNGIKETVHDENEGLTKLITYILSVQHAIKTAVIWTTFDKEKKTENAVYNFCVYKMINRRPHADFSKCDKLYFANGFLNIEILKLLQLEAIEKGGTK